MKSKLLISALLLTGMSVGAQTPISVYISDDCSQNNKIENLIPSGIENGYTWVNMGLSVKWATMNIGATAPEDYGNYYAWAETTPKTDYSVTTYKYGGGYLTKYCSNYYIGNGFTDNKTLLEPTDDAAHENWGGNWRMPTKAEWEELFQKCRLTTIKLNGVDCFRITANNGNSIFLPAAGMWNGTNFVSGYVSSMFYTEYWSSECINKEAYVGHLMDYYSITGIKYMSRVVGLPVRPVCP